MNRIKELWSRYKILMLVEILVIAIMLGSAGIMYKQTYELEYQKVMCMNDKIGSVTAFDEGADVQTSDFLVNLYESYMYDFNNNNIGNKYYGYGITWEIYDKNDNVIDQSTDSDLMLLWYEQREELDGQEEYYGLNKAYLLEKYFTKEEVEKARDFIDSMKEEAKNNIIEKVVGYYNQNNEYVPVEIVFFDNNKNESYSLKNEESINKGGVTYVTRKGKSIAAEYVVSEENGFFCVDNLKKRKATVNKAIEKAKESGDDTYYRLDSGIFFTEYEMPWYASADDNMTMGEEQNGPSRIKIGFCADLNYMTFNNTIFKYYLIADIILCVLIGMGIVYITRKNDERRKYLDAMKYTFINAMAHEMKTPSAVIVNSVECINEGIKPEKQSKYLEKVKKEGLHMNRLLLDMLTYTKLTDEDRKIHKEEIDMKGLFQEVIEHYNDAIENKNIQVQWDIKSEKIIMADRKLMEMVVDNYLSNAVKYCTQSGVIKITMDEKNIVVFNNGEIIYPAKQKAIWEPLYVMDESRKNREGSSGMGLAISARIMDLHGMQYGVRNVDNGVEFYIITK